MITPGKCRQANQIMALSLFRREQAILALHTAEQQNQSYRDATARAEGELAGARAGWLEQISRKPIDLPIVQLCSAFVARREEVLRAALLDQSIDDRRLAKARGLADERAAGEKIAARIQNRVRRDYLAGLEERRLHDIEDLHLRRARA